MDARALQRLADRLLFSPLEPSLFHGPAHGRHMQRARWKWSKQPPAGLVNLSHADQSSGPVPPITDCDRASRLVPARLVAAESGRVVITLVSTGANLCTAASRRRYSIACMGLAVQTMLEKGISQTTLEFKDFSRSLHHARDGPDQNGGQGSQLWPPHRHSRRMRHGRQRSIAHTRHDDVSHFSDLTPPHRFVESTDATANDPQLRRGPRGTRGDRRHRRPDMTRRAQSARFERVLGTLRCVSKGG